MGIRLGRYIRYVPRKFFLTFLYAFVLFGLFIVYRSSSRSIQHNSEEVIVKRDIPNNIGISLVILVQIFGWGWKF